MRRFKNSKTGEMKSFWSLDDVCQKYDVHRNTVQNWKKRGLPSLDWKKFVLFPLPEARIWIETNVAPVVNPADEMTKHPYLK